MSKELSELFDRNREWATKVEAARPGFFTSLLAPQKPRYMWLGCADSRVPANELVDLLPGVRRVAGYEPVQHCRRGALSCPCLLYLQARKRSMLFVC